MDGIGLVESDTTPALGSPGEDGSVLPSTHHKAELSTYCLYFLVCAAASAPLAGLMKVGIADHLPTRYREHTRTWGRFDLRRSALLRVRNRREALQLEQALRNFFADPVAESIAKAAGKTLTSEDFIAMGSSRRYPGRRDAGFTEFFAFACLARMLAYVEEWRTSSSEREAGTRLQRGISPTDCALKVQAGDAPPPLTPERRKELRAQQRAGWRRAREEVNLQVEAKLVQVLDLALAYENHLVWVNLRFWRWMRDVAGPGESSEEGLVDLYFDRFGSVSFGADAEQAGRSAAQIRFEERVEAIAAPIESTHGGWWDRRRPGSICFLTTPEPRSLCPLPHPVCAGRLLLRVESCLSDLHHPLFAQFDALARRVESRHRREQLVLC